MIPKRGRPVHSGRSPAIRDGRYWKNDVESSGKREPPGRNVPPAATHAARRGRWGVLGQLSKLGQFVFVLAYSIHTTHYKTIKPIVAIPLVLAFAALEQFNFENILSIFLCGAQRQFYEQYHC
jgi:hypothetical protein